MELENLTKGELAELFLQVHGRYLDVTNKNFRDYIRNPDFIIIEEELTAVLNELQRRREMK
jgi:hypothetical protein